MFADESVEFLGNEQFDEERLCGSLELKVLGEIQTLFIDDLRD